MSERPRRQPAMDLTRELGWLAFDPARARRLGGTEARTRLVDRGATFCAAGSTTNGARGWPRSSWHWTRWATTP